MIIGDKKFSTLKEAVGWGQHIAEHTGWKYVGAVVSSTDGQLKYAAKWEY